MYSVIQTICEYLWQARLKLGGILRYIGQRCDFDFKENVGSKFVLFGSTVFISYMVNVNTSNY